MMKKVMKLICYYSLILLLSWVTVIEVVGATQPRITPGLLSPEKLEMFVYEYPPLASLDIPGGGLFPEIIQAALDKENIKVSVTILPVKSLVKYNLLLDNAIAIIGDGWNFSEQEREQLIFIPFGIIHVGYYYYMPVHERELSIDGNLANLKEYRYGALKGENVKAFKEAGISISYGNIASHFKKLKNKEVDFVSAPDVSKEWIVSKYYPGESNNFAIIQNSSRETPTTIIFNKKNTEAETVARKFSEGLVKIQKDGTYMEILERYLGTGNTPKDYFRRLEYYQKKGDSLNR